VSGGKSETTTDYAESFRRDIGVFPPDIVLMAARRHVLDLKALSRETPGCEKAIDDVEAFIKEHQGG
jgi:hypothetical protein